MRKNLKVIRSPLFTDEELSVVMDAHEQRVLAIRGKLADGNCCLLMATKGVDDLNVPTGWAWQDWYRELGEITVDHAINWFDEEYNANWTADELLQQLEAQGLA